MGKKQGTNEGRPLAWAKGASQAKLYKELVPGGSAAMNPNQLRTRAVYKFAPVLLSTSLSAIIADSSNQVRLSGIPNYTYLQSLWEEYRILAAEWRIVPCTPSATGVTAFYCDESDTTVPTLSTAGQKLGMTVTNSSNAVPNRGYYQVKWAAQDLKDLQWTATTSTTTFVTLKAYTDGNYGCSTTSTPIWLVTCWIELELRGQGGN